MDVNKLQEYIKFVSDVSESVTQNTLENLYNKWSSITNEQLLEIHNYNALLLQCENVNNDEIKAKLIADIVNKFETYVSQL